jgi:hypothetical protein
MEISSLHLALGNPVIWRALGIDGDRALAGMGGRVWDSSQCQRPLPHTHTLHNGQPVLAVSLSWFPRTCPSPQEKYRVSLQSPPASAHVCLLTGTLAAPLFIWMPTPLSGRWTLKGRGYCCPIPIWVSQIHVLTDGNWLNAWANSPRQAWGWIHGLCSCLLSQLEEIEWICELAVSHTKSLTVTNANKYFYYLKLE